MLKNKVVYISSTGGHLSELLQLSPLFEKYDYVLITEKDKTNLSLKDEYPGHVKYLPYGTRAKLFTYVFKYLAVIVMSAYYFFTIKPKVIVTTGTHTAIPICYIGKLFGCKILFIETFANSNKQTMSGKMIYPIADKFIVQWEEMLKLYPKAEYGGKIY